MKRLHFQTLRPICPLCLMRTRAEHQLKIGVEAIADQHAIHHGALHCTNPECQCEYPIIDGIPMLVPHIRAYIANNLLHLQARRDLPEIIEDMLGDGCGPNSAFDSTRQHLSSYIWDHYGEFDPNETAACGLAHPAPGSVARVLTAALELSAQPITAPILDIACSVGRSTFELAQSNSHNDQLVLGVDLNFSMLQIAARIMNEGKLTYSRRRTGLVYYRREFDVKFDGANNVDFWMCDAASLPFPAKTFGGALGLNIIDCVPSPLDVLGEMKRVLTPDSPLILSTPYDWSGAVTAPEAWIGGHSKRSHTGGEGAPLLRALLTPGAHPASIPNIQLQAECEMPWSVRLHDRSFMQYQVHIAIARTKLTTQNMENTEERLNGTTDKRRYMVAAAIGSK